MNDNSHSSAKLHRLADAIRFLRAAQRRRDSTVPDPIIEAFALCFEVSWMQIRAALSAAGSPPAVNLPALFRQAQLHRLIDSADHWMDYLTLRDMASRNGDSAHSRAIIAELPTFLVDAESLLAELQSRSRTT